MEQEGAQRAVGEIVANVEGGRQGGAGEVEGEEVAAEVDALRAETRGEGAVGAMVAEAGERRAERREAWAGLHPVAEGSALEPEIGRAGGEDDDVVAEQPRVDHAGRQQG